MNRIVGIALAIGMLLAGCAPEPTGVPVTTAAPAAMTPTLSPSPEPAPGPLPTPAPEPTLKETIAALESRYGMDATPALLPSAAQSGEAFPIAFNPNELEAVFSGFPTGNGLAAALADLGVPGDAGWLQGAAGDGSTYHMDMWKDRLTLGEETRDVAVAHIYSANRALALVFQREGEWRLTDVWHAVPMEPAEDWIRPIELGDTTILAVTAPGDRGAGIFHERHVQLYDPESHGFAAAFHGNCREAVKYMEHGMVTRYTGTVFSVQDGELAACISQRLAFRDAGAGNSPDAREWVVSEGLREQRYESGLTMTEDIAYQRRTGTERVWLGRPVDPGSIIRASYTGGDDGLFEAMHRALAEGPWTDIAETMRAAVDYLPAGTAGSVETEAVLEPYSGWVPDPEDKEVRKEILEELDLAYLQVGRVETGMLILFDILEDGSYIPFLALELDNRSESWRFERHGGERWFIRELEHMYGTGISMTLCDWHNLDRGGVPISYLREAIQRSSPPCPLGDWGFHGELSPPDIREDGDGFTIKMEAGHRLSRYNALDVGEEWLGEEFIWNGSEPVSIRYDSVSGKARAEGLGQWYFHIPDPEDTTEKYSLPFLDELREASAGEGVTALWAEWVLNGGGYWPDYFAETGLEDPRDD